MLNSLNVVSQFESWVALNPAGIAVVSDGNKWTYYDLNNYANYISRKLLGFGINESDVIGVAGAKSFEMIAFIIAILKIRCSYVPIDMTLPDSQLAYMLENANVHYVLSQAGSTNRSRGLDSVLHFSLTYDDFDSSSQYDNINKTISSDDPAYVMYTSGSTGVPKGVIVPHRGLIRLLVNSDYIDLRPSDSVLFHSNTSFDAAIFEVWAALLNGAKIVISPYLIGDIPSIFKLCQEQCITILLLATGLFHVFSKLEIDRLSHLRYLVVGGDVMHSTAAINVINKNNNLKIINGYGPAENTVFTTCLVISCEKDIDNPVSIGKAINNTEVYILDDNLLPVQAGDIGELCTSGLGVALGYINAPELTAEKFIKLPGLKENGLVYRTGDMARVLPSGNLEFIGRRDSQVKIRGFRVELTAIENVIASLRFVQDVCVCLVQNERIAAFIKPSQLEYDELLCGKSAIFSFLKERLPAYCIPTYIQINNDFPLTANGKIDRKLLRQSLNENEKVYI